MRLVQVEHLADGDIIAEDILSETGAILLRRTSVFKQAYKPNLVARNIKYIYIEDEISKGIEPRKILSVQIQNRIYKDISTEFDKIKSSLSINYELFSQISLLLMEELAGKDIYCEITDLKTNHTDTYNHCIGVAIMTTIVCKKMGLTQEATQKIVLGALLHDIGKMIIPKDILDKPGALTEEEYEIIKTHALVGYEMIKNHPTLSPITKVAVLCHHEREDGKGYPLGKQEDLHIGAKIVAGCDVFHALLCDRAYRRGLPVNRAIMIAKGEKLDNQVREAIESILAFYPVGEMVGLSNGEFGIVEKNFAENLTKPLVRVIYKANIGQIKPYKIDLREQDEVYIVDKVVNFES
ncbi:MAG: HD-GYP domain-containing protein [Cellulosilyticaceae bacterium]